MKGPSVRERLAKAIGKCSLPTDHKVSIGLDTTGIEVVDVLVTAPPSARTCLQEAAWDLRLYPSDKLVKGVGKITWFHFGPKVANARSK